MHGSAKVAYGFQPAGGPQQRLCNRAGVPEQRCLQQFCPGANARVCCHHAFPTQQQCELRTGLDSSSAGVDTFDVLQPATIYSVDGSTLTLRFFWGTAGFADGSPLAFNVTGYDSNTNQVCVCNAVDEEHGLLPFFVRVHKGYILAVGLVSVCPTCRPAKHLQPCLRQSHRPPQDALAVCSCRWRQQHSLPTMRSPRCSRCRPASRGSQELNGCELRTAACWLSTIVVQLPVIRRDCIADGDAAISRPWEAPRTAAGPSCCLHRNVL